MSSRMNFIFIAVLSLLIHSTNFQVKAEGLTQGQASLWVQEQIVTAGTAHAFGLGAQEDYGGTAYLQSLTRPVQTPVQGDPSAAGISAPAWFLDELFSSSSSSSGAQTVNLGGAGLAGNLSFLQAVFTNAQSGASQPGQLMSNMLLGMDSNNALLNATQPSGQSAYGFSMQNLTQSQMNTLDLMASILASAPTSSSNQSAILSTPTSGGPSSSGVTTPSGGSTTGSGGGSGSGGYNWLTSGMY